MVTGDRLQKALHYLATTDEVAAKAKAYMIGIEDTEKTILSTELLKHEGTAQHRESMARTSDAYKDWARKHEESVYDFEILRNKRNTEALVVEVWRSLNANRRNGNI
jgi:hypothetical protein